jgi:iron-sulfur cluster repair protein YtfE (RIC family)
MTSAPNLLNDDGTASIATGVMLSHHAFRRDLARFTKALAELEATGPERTTGVEEEWKNFRGALHGHHEAEDKGIFPGLSAEHPTIAKTIEELSADHRRIDPLLEKGDHAFADLTVHRVEAARVVQELGALLAPHLAKEEATVLPFLRGVKSFPVPATDAEADLYAKGFSWAMHGIAPEVLEKVGDMLPEALRTRLPAARAEFEARCLRAWGSTACGSATTPIPNGP